MNKPYFIIIASFIFSSLALGQNTKSLETLTKVGQFAVSVRDVSSGTLIHNLNGHKVMSPASVLKTITTFTALEKLGRDYTYETKLMYSGQITNGVLHGDLILWSNGDPTLASTHFDNFSLDQVFEDMIKAIQQNGIQKIDGNLIIDDSYFQGITQSRNWYYKDLANYYACGVWSINMHDNLFYLHFKQNASVGGQPEIAHTYPDMSHWLTIENELSSGSPSSGDNAYLFGDANSQLYTVRGSIPSGSGLFDIRGAIPRLPQYMLSVFKDELHKHRIEVTGTYKVNKSKGQYSASPELWNYQSPPLSDIIKITNEKSVNMFSEVILRTLGEKFSTDTRKASVEKGVEVVMDHFRNKGIEVESWDIVDGSGLSPLNLISTESLTDFYTKSYQVINIREELIRSLAEGGKEGTLTRLFSSNSPLYGNVWAKSGSIENVYNLGGYMKCKSGKMFAFAVFLSEFEGSYAAARSAISQYLLSIWEGN